MKIATLKISLLALFALLFVTPSTASTVQVGGCKSGFTNYPTISAAVAAVPAGSTVLVCPGTYSEQVDITQSLTLQGVQTSSAANPVITVPTGATGTFYQVNIVGGIGSSITVNLSNIGVNGSSSSTQGVIGVVYQSASGTLSHMAIYNQGGAGGTGVFISNSDSTQTVTVSKSSIHDFTEAAISTYLGGNAVIEGNQIVASDSFSGSATGGGIVLYSSGSITNNLVITHPQPAGVSAGTGIQTESNATVTGNTIENFSVGIWLLDGSNTAKSNTILLAGSGIVISGNDNIVELNSFINEAPGGVAVDFNCTGTGNTVTNNTISDTYMAFAGYCDTNTTSPNSFFNVPFIGL
jgi:hypothetical protein